MAIATAEVHLVHAINADWVTTHKLSQLTHTVCLPLVKFSLSTADTAVVIVKIQFKIQL